MKPTIQYHLFIFLLVSISCSDRKAIDHINLKGKDTILKISMLKESIKIPTLADTCFCDSNSVKKFVQQKLYNSIRQYDTKSFPKYKFYDLDSQINRSLWFRDIENPTKTKFTELWDAYKNQNYYADPIDFLNFYDSKKDIPLAFIFGPNSDLWSYHIFVIKKINCCYLITRSYYRHNRFTYKGFAILEHGKLKKLYSTIKEISLITPDLNKSYGYAGYFMDNLNSKKFLIDFKNETINTKDSNNVYSSAPKQEVINLYRFLNESFTWTKTFGE